jgi:hypothetical protein
MREQDGVDKKNVMIHKVKKERGVDGDNGSIQSYTTILNEIVKNPDLSFKATGLALYILSFSPFWGLNGKHLASLKKEDRYAVDSAIQELKAQGYLHIQYDVRNEKGQFNGGKWEFFEDRKMNPYFENPKAGNPNTGNPSYKTKNNKGFESKDSNNSKTGENKKPYRKECKNLWQFLVNESHKFGVQLIDDPTSHLQKACMSLPPDTIKNFYYDALFQNATKAEIDFIQVFHKMKMWNNKHQVKTMPNIAAALYNTFGFISSSEQFMEIDEWLESDYCNPKQIMNAIKRMRLNEINFIWNNFKKYVRDEEQLLKDQSKWFSDKRNRQGNRSH